MLNSLRPSPPEGSNASEEQVLQISHGQESPEEKRRRQTRELLQKMRKDGAPRNQASESEDVYGKLFGENEGEEVSPEVDENGEAVPAEEDETPKARFAPAVPQGRLEASRNGIQGASRKPKRV